MEAILGWFDEAHGIRRIACMIEKGNVPSERLAARLGFAAYGEAEADDDGVLLTLYERHGPPAPKPA
jgi:RimJ/RimL family protein N-acetyltransferase